MEIRLIPAAPEDAETLYELQVAAFLPLVEKYHDYERSPACEPIGRLRERMSQADTCYYLILCDGEPAGGIRVQTLSPGRYRFAPLFVHPEYQGRGIARQALPLAEALCPGALSWQLETILEEPRLCRFYESLGYVATGEEEEVPDSFLTLVHYRKDA